MKLEFYPAEKLKKEILEIVGKYLDLSEYKIFLFGSRVTGKGNERSDIDVGVEGKEPIPSSIFLDIQEEIEKLPTLYKIEIVEFARVEKKFKEVALQQIEAIN